MKRFLCILLALVMALSMAGCAEKDSPRRNHKKPTEEPVAQSQVQPISVLVGGQYINRWSDDYIQLAFVSWQDVILADESAASYPKLAAALANWNRETHAMSEVALGTMCESAQNVASQIGQDFPAYYDDSRTYVQRADSRIFSLCCQYEIFDGGMRPYSGTTCLNLDPNTGKPVTIDQVITDMEGLPQLLEDSLRKKYSYIPGETFDGTAKLLKSYAPEAYTWTMSYQGVTFYFGAYELAEGAAGALTVTLWFADSPKLFEESYTQRPANGYTISLPLADYVDVDLTPGDGKTDLLGMGLTVEGNMWIELNDSRIYNQEFFSYHMDAYLVTPDNENFYLYTDCSSDNDYHAIHVYELKDGQPVLLTVLWGGGFEGLWVEDYELGATYFIRLFNNPTHYTLYTRTEVLSTVTGSRPYHTDPKTGLPQADTDYYRLSSDMPPLISMIPLEVEMLPDETTETLPAGTRFYFLRTDNATYVDMGLEDGRECRIKAVRRDWEWYVNGHSEYDCFENSMYAG